MANKLRKWLDAASADEIKNVAKAADVTVPTLRQIAGAYRTEGVVHARPETAQAITKAISKFHREGLPNVSQEDLCPACKKCDYFKHHK